MVETVKHGLIADSAFFEYLKNEPGDGSPAHFPDLTYITEKNVRIKSSFVETDEFDRGRRQMLNFGHTIGHTIEKNSDFTISHGRAVAIGMCAATKAAYACGLAEEDYSPIIAETLRRYGLDLTCPYPAALLTEAALRDKKRSGDTINIIYLKKIGEAAVHTLPVGELEAFLRAGQPWICA